MNYRCVTCGKLLGKEGPHTHTLEVKCVRCGSFNVLFSAMQEQVIITDPNGIILYANDAVNRVTGYSQTEVIGQKPSLWGGQMSSEFYKSMWHTLTIEKQSIDVTITNRHKDGHLYKARLCITPVFDKDSTITCFVGIESLIPPLDDAHIRHYEESTHT